MFVKYRTGSIIKVGNRMVVFGILYGHCIQGEGGGTPTKVYAARNGSVPSIVPTLEKWG